MESTLLLVLHYMRIPLLAQMVESACNSEDPGWIPGSGRCPREGNDNPLQYSCLENPMDGGAWWATVHRVAKTRARLKQLSMHVHTAVFKMNNQQKPIVLAAELCSVLCGSLHGRGV